MLRPDSSQTSIARWTAEPWADQSAGADVTFSTFSRRYASEQRA